MIEPTIVDIDVLFKEQINDSVAIDYLDARQACHALLFYLRDHHPNGVILK